MRMLPHVKKLVAIELDGRMVAEVRKRAHTEGRLNFEVIQGDALRTPFPKFDVCVANLPYQISSAFTFKVLAHRPLYRCAVLRPPGAERAALLCRHPGLQGVARQLQPA